MTTHRTYHHWSPRSLSSRSDGAALTLTDEHALLLGRVTARAEDVLTVAARDEWPRRELRRLLDCLRTEVLRQVDDEEELLFRHRSGPPGLGRLSRDHLRLRHCVEALARAADRQSRSTLVQLAATTRDLLTLLEHHLAVEEKLLAGTRAPHAVPATAVLAGRSHRRYPRIEGAVVDLDGDR